MKREKMWFVGLCPRLKCKDCVVKHCDPYYVKPAQRRKDICPFYKDFSDGYAGGFIKKDGVLKRIREMKQCPREYLFCTECKEIDCAERTGNVRT